MQAPDVSQWDEPDWGIKAPLVGRTGFAPGVGAPGQAWGRPRRGASRPRDGPTRSGGRAQRTGLRVSYHPQIDCWADDVPELYERAKAEQWVATRDIPWHDLPELQEDIDRAVCQVMTFLVENEYVAMYLPAKFIEDIAPDPVTKEILVRTRQDEARHVGYGVSHIRYLLGQDPSLSNELLEAAEERASFLRASSGANPFLQRSLAVLAGGGSEEKQVEHGVEMVREFYRKIHETRIPRLMTAGLDEDKARKIAELHGGGGKAYM